MTTREHARASAIPGTVPPLPASARILAWVARTILRCVLRVRVEGLEHVPRSGPLIVAVNHLSNADPPLVGGWLIPAVGRRVRWLAKEQLFAGPVGRILRSQGVVMVRRGGQDVEAYREARAALARGEVVVLFPEGTRSLTGTLGEPRQGLVLLAARSGAPVLPVGITGTNRFLSPGARWPRIGTTVHLRFGEPFQVALERGAGRRNDLARATDGLMSHIAALLPPAARGRFGRPPA